MSGETYTTILDARVPTALIDRYVDRIMQTVREKTMKIESQFEATLTITINDAAPDDLFTRGQDPDWYEVFYGRMSQEEVIGHWAHNAAANGVRDIAFLDGWADVPQGAVRLAISDVETQP